MFCKNCGTKIEENALFCKKCGISLDQNNDNLSSNENVKINEIDKETYVLSYNKGIVSVFDISGDNVVLSQYTNSMKSNPKNVYEFKKHNISKIKYTRGVRPSILSKIRVTLAVFFLIVSIILFPVFIFSIPYGLFVFLIDTIKCIKINLKSGQKIKVFYAVKSEASDVADKIVS